MSDIVVEPGDLIEDTSGFFLRVTWVKDGECGAVDPQNPCAGNVFKLSEIKLIRKKERDFLERMFEEELKLDPKLAIEQARAARVRVPPPKERAKREKDKVAQALRDLSPEELEKLKKVLAERG